MRQLKDMDVGVRNQCELEVLVQCAYILEDTSL